EILLRHLHKTAHDYVNAYKSNGSTNGKHAAKTDEKDAAHV
ncbi:MAG: hypothetical protein QOF67_547, partial [Mycobacterium sp.]|nr:hypothetical protein [Mycobacterium sp.]